MRKILVGNNISEKCISGLRDRGFEVVLLPPFSMLDGPVSTHADMLTFYFGGRLLTHGAYYTENKELFDGLGVCVELIPESVGSTYPDDILLNAVLTEEGILFSKTSAISEAVKSLATAFVGVKQGYTACSTCRVTDKAFLTTDSGLCRQYTENGIRSIAVTKEGIDLPGYDCGFIGGSSFVTEEAVCFFGRVEDHPDYENIKAFVEGEGKKIISLSNEKLTDIGGAVVI